MSFILSDLVRRCKVGNKTYKAILRCLCDYADEAGRCFPSHASIIAEVECDKKIVTTALLFLEKNGWITIERHQKGNSNAYCVNVSKLNSAPENGQTVHPKTGIPENGYTRKRVDSTPENGKTVYPKTGNEYINNISRIYQSNSNSCSDIESSPKTVTTQKSQSTREKQLPKPNDISEEVWSDFLKLRKAKKAPFTATALKRMQKQADIAGLSLQEVFEICCSKGWIGFEASWINNRKINGFTPKRIEPDFSDPNYYLEE